MKSITMIKINGCPYCINALRAFEELRVEYNDINLEIIDENTEQEKAIKYTGEYYYVPTLFVDGKKVYEANPKDDYEAVKAGVVGAIKCAKQ